MDDLTSRPLKTLNLLRTIAFQSIFDFDFDFDFEIGNGSGLAAACSSGLTAAFTEGLWRLLALFFSYFCERRSQSKNYVLVVKLDAATRVEPRLIDRARMLEGKGSRRIGQILYVDVKELYGNL